MPVTGAAAGWGCLARLSGRILVLGAGLALAACQTDGSGTASAPYGRTLAFDSIDGPPQGTFDKLVQDLSSEAQGRQVSVVSRSGDASYRVRGYMAVHVEKGKAKVAYAWDVYDAQKQYVTRISGEETAGAVKGDAKSNGWAACNDAVIQKIAGQTMAQLSAAVGGSPGRVAPAAEPAAAAPAQETPEPARAPQPADGDGPPVADAGTAGSALAFSAE